MEKENHFLKNKKINHLLGHYVTDTARAMIRTLSQNFRKAGYHITPDQWIVLIWLFEKEGRTQQEICDLTFKDKPSLSRILNNLEKRNMIIRTGHPGDGRSKVIFLTKECKKLEPALIQIAENTQTALIKGIPQSEIDLCKRTLAKIINNIN